MARALTVLAALALMCATAVASRFANVPVTSTMVFSSQKTFTRDNIAAAAAPADLYNVFATLAGQERDSSSRSPLFRDIVTATAPAPLITLAVSATGLTKPQTAQALGLFTDSVPTLTNFAAALAAAPSSLAVSDVYVPAAEVAPALRAVRATRGTALSFTATATTDCAELTSIVSSLSTARASSLLHVTAPDAAALAAVDACLPPVLAALAAASRDRYAVALVGAPAPGARGMRTTFGALAELEAQEGVFLQLGSQIRADAGVTAGEETFNGPEYVTSDVITVMLVVFLGLGILALGFSFTLAIETPVRYATPSMALPVTREY